MDNLLKYWINSIPLEGCALLEGTDALRDGTVYMEMISFVEEGAHIPMAEASTSDEGRIRGVICFLAERHSWSSMPHALRQSDASERIASGDPDMAMLLVKYIKFIFDCYAEAEDEATGDESNKESSVSSVNNVGVDNSAPAAPSRPRPVAVRPGQDSQGSKTNSNNASTRTPPESIGTVSASSGPSRINNNSAVASRPRSHNRPPSRASAPSRGTDDNRPDPAAPIRSALKQPKQAPVSPVRNMRADKRTEERPRGSASQAAEVRISSYADVDRESMRNKSPGRTADHARSSSAFPLPAQLRAEIILWLEALGVYSASVSYRRVHHVPGAEPGSGRQDQPLSPLEDPWCNGVLLCELAAVLCKTGDRSLIKEIPAVCACGLKKPEHFARHQELTERSSRRGTPAAAQSTSSGCSLLPGSAVVDREAGLGWHRDRPRIVLAGTVIHVKSMAQVLKNIKFALAILKNPDMTGLPKSHLLPVSCGSQDAGQKCSITNEDVLDCLPEEVVTGQVSIWQILRRIYVADKYNSNKLQNRSRSRSRSPSTARAKASRSVGSSCESNRSAVDEDRTRGLTQASKDKETEKHPQMGSRSPVILQNREIVDASVASKVEESKVEAVSNPTFQAPPKSISEENQFLSASVSDSWRNSQRKENKTLRQPEWNGTVTPERRRKVVDIKATFDRGRLNTAQIWGNGVAPKSILRSKSNSPVRKLLKHQTNPFLQKLSATIDDSVAGAGIVLHTKNSAQRKKKAPSHSNRTTDGLNAAIALRDAFPPVTSQQQESIRRWIIDLGVEFRDGDGGFLSRSFGTTVCAPTHPELHDDRLRNGMTLCDLGLILEPNAARHLGLDSLVKRNLKSIPQARNNVEKAQFLFRIRRCPPIPLKYLMHPDLVLKGKKNVLWGLLWEIMQAYPAVAVGQSLADIGSVIEGIESNVKPSTEREDVLLTAPSMKSTSGAEGPFSPDSVTNVHKIIGDTTDPRLMHSLAKHQVPSFVEHCTGQKDVAKLFTSRRKKERIICDWIQNLRLDGFLQDVVGLYAINLQEQQRGEHGPINVPSLPALENIIRNGTLLCSIAGGVFKTPIKTWSKQPKSYNQCLYNVEKAIEGFQRVKELPPGVFYAGVEDDIVRGEWSIIVELLFELASVPNKNIKLCRKEEPNHELPPPRWGAENAAEIIPIKEKRLSGMGPSQSQTLNIFESDLLDSDCSTPHLPVGSADIYPEMSGNPESAVPNSKNCGGPYHQEKTVDSRSKEPESDDLIALLGIGSMGITKPSPTDSEVAAIMGESISSKLIRELEEAASCAAKPVQVQENFTVASGPADTATSRTSKSNPDIFPGSSGSAPASGRKRDMILVQPTPQPKGVNTPESSLQTPGKPSSSPDWVKKIKSEGIPEKRPLNMDHDEVQSVQDSPVQDDTATRRIDGLLKSVSKPDRESASGSRTVGGKWPIHRNSSAPPSKRLPPSVNYNSHPLPKAGQDILTSKRIRDAKILISWLTDLNVDTEPLKNLIRIVRDYKDQNDPPNCNSDTVVGYVNPLPASFPKKDISSTICELVSTLDWKYPSAGSFSHAAPGKIPGTVTVPKYHAQRLQNIRRAFDVLSNNNKIPLSALSCEEAILEGRIDVVINLLMTIRKAYNITVGRRS